jgi:multiple sugar transport system permease protein
MKKIVLGKKKKQLISGTVSWLAIAVISLIFIYPLLFLFMNSLRQYLNKTPLLWFSEGHWENFYFAVAMVPFFKYLFNTLKLVIIVLTCSMTFDFLYGYALARLNAPGKKIVFALVMIQLMIPSIAITIPQFIYYNQLDIMNTYWIWVLAGVGGNAYLIFLTKQFLQSFPRELEEAAKIDGCSLIGIIWRIFLPLSKPIMAIIIFNQFCGTWNDYMGPYMFFDSKKYPLAAALFGNMYFIKDKAEVILEPVTMAACVLFSIPVIFMFFVMQKYLVEGIVTTGIKG